MASVVTLSIALPYLLPYIDILAERIMAMRKPVISPLARFYLKYVNKARARTEKYARKYGFLGLTIFIAIPLPATGIWTGTIGAHVLGIPRKHTITASILGGTISLFIMFAATYPLIELIS